MPAASAPLVAWVVLSTPLWVIVPWRAWRDGGDHLWSLAAMLALAAAVNGLPLLFLMQPRRLRVAPDGVWFDRRLLGARRWHPLDIRGATARAVTGTRPSHVWFERTSGGDAPVYQCRSVAEAEWFAKELDRALGEAKKRRMSEAD